MPHNSEGFEAHRGGSRNLFAELRPAEMLDRDDVLRALCRLKGKYGMLLHLRQASPEARRDFFGPNDAVRPAPYLTRDDIIAGQFDDFMWTFFDTREDMEACYEATVGPDGPTPSNRYDGPACVLAVTCGPDGELLNENT